MAQTPTGSWVGTYLCVQGVTGLTLTIDEDHEGGLEGVFAFYPVAQNPGTTTESYRVHIAYYEEVHHLVISATNDDWIQRPSGYNVVDLDGTISSDGTVFSGSILASGCSTFALSRQSLALGDGGTD